MVEHGVFKLGSGSSVSMVPDCCDKNPSYVIFTECMQGGCRGVRYRKYLLPGTRIRLDLFCEFPFWKVPELKRCKNWRVAERCKKYGCVTYYVDILSANYTGKE